VKPRLALGALCLAPLLGAAEPPAADATVFQAMRAELARTTSDLHLPGAGAPYYASYWVVDSAERSVEATLGTLVSDSMARERFVKIELRVGSALSDNSNFAGGASLDGDFMKEAELLSPRQAPLDDDVAALRRQLWLATDAAYKNAVETLQRKRGAKQSEIAARTEVPSFSSEASSTVVVRDAPPADRGDPEGVARRVSAVFRKFPEVQKSSVHVLASTARRRFLASDGGLAVEPLHFAGLEITCEGQAEDGMAVERSAFLSARSDGQLPEASAIAEAERVAAELVALRGAKVAADYSGPVLFEGRAAAQLAYELLGDSLSGTPAPEGNDDMESPLGRKLGKRVLPRGFTVVDDPTLTTYAGAPLLGHYAVDDEGVAAERALLVDDGHLKGFLMSRTPREGILRSNGHGRSGLIGWARARPANLLVSARGGLSRKELRAKLASVVREEGAEFGIVVTELATRTSTTNGTMMPAPELAYRVTPDGKETLLRGATFAQMSVRDLRDVLAAGRDAAVYSFVTENDGGLDLPTSIAAPALLFEDVEVRGPSNPNKRPPVVPRPAIDPAAR
jgi:predicted Zn-dependent protease